MTTRVNWIRDPYQAMLRRTIPVSRFLRFQSTSVKPSSIPILSQQSATPKTTDDTGRPFPVNLEAVYHSPLKLPVEYGDLVADLQLRSYDNENLDFFADFILRAGYYLGMPLTGPKPLPTRRERWTVIRSPFAQAKSKENFERHTHKRLIRVWDTNPEVVQIWLSYITKHSITGVGMKCNIYQRAGLSLDVDSLTNIALPQVSQEGQPSGTDKPLVNTFDEAVGEKIVELLNSPEFKKHI